MLVASGNYNMHAFIGISGVEVNYRLAQLQKTNFTYGVLVENLAIGGRTMVSINDGTKIVNTDAFSSYRPVTADPDHNRRQRWADYDSGFDFRDKATPSLLVLGTRAASVISR